VWKRLAYATRYGHVPLTEVLHMDSTSLADYLAALNEIVGEENRPAKGSR
jgi:hypothetical protein